MDAMTRRRFAWLCLVVAVALWVSALSHRPMLAATAQPHGPSIDVWYHADQQFGAAGSPVRFVNILGRIAPADTIANATFSLNGGTATGLKLGPDSRRLAKSGDFNVEVETDSLREGENTVLIAAKDKSGHEGSQLVRVHYTARAVPRLPAEVKWNAVSRIDQAAQVLDGRWELTPEGVRTVEIGYDRLIAVGDMYWKDFEVCVPITIHSFDTSVHGHQPSVHSAAGVVLRWHGHLDWDGTRPRWGYAPAGAIAWYSFIPELDGYRLTFMGGPDMNVRFFGSDPMARQLQLGVAYFFKARVQSRVGRPAHYRLKVWKVGSPEPERWDLSADGMKGELTQGSILLIAHHADATFGDVRVAALRPEE